MSIGVPAGNNKNPGQVATAVLALAGSAADVLQATPLRSAGDLTCWSCLVQSFSATISVCLNIREDLGVDSVDQFQVQTAGISAQYGGQGMQNFTLKSGTNK